MGAPPKKYIKLNGIMKLNPEYKRYKENENKAAAGPMAVAAPATTVMNSSQALPIVSSMEDYEKMNDNLGETPLAESTVATIEMLQEPEIAAEAGLNSDDMIDELGKILGKYECPIGLLNKLMMLSEYASLEFIIDDSGSMTLATDTVDPKTRRNITRWAEAQMRLKEMIEIVAYVPFNQIGIEFLNRKNRISLKRNGRAPKDFLSDAYSQIDAVFRQGPSGTTPALEKLKESLLRGQGTNIARYFFGDGVPNGGRRAIEQITQLLLDRSDPESNPVTFISCTNEDEAVEWMKDAEEVSLTERRKRIITLLYKLNGLDWIGLEVLQFGSRLFIIFCCFSIPNFVCFVFVFVFQIALYCSESDDFADEAKEVYRDQGAALPYSKGFHLICQWVAAMNPEDLDAMDESIPFTKFTLDNLLGVVSNEETYRHYFESFVKAQQARRIEIDERTGMPSKLDTVRKQTRWDYNSFLRAEGTRKKISQVGDYQEQLRRAASGH